MNTEPPRRMAFTLLELLVAMAVFTLLAVLLFGVLGEVNRAWEQAQAQIEPRKSGRAILDYFTRELEIATLPANRTMTYATASSPPISPDLGFQFLVNPSGFLSPKFFNPQALFWQAPIGSNGFAEVGFFVRWDESTPNQPRAVLCRLLIKPGDSNYFIQSNPTNWLTDAVLNRAAPGVMDSNDPTLSYRGWLADNVIGLWARCLDPRGNPITNSALNTAYAGSTYDSRKGYRYSTGTATNALSSFTPSGTTSQVLATLPASVEVAVVILDSRSAAKLTQKPAYPVTSPTTPHSFWADINTFVSNLPAPVRSGARIYSTRVTLRNADSP